MRVLIADDHPLFRMGLALALGAEGFDVANDRRHDPRGAGSERLDQCVHTDVRADPHAVGHARRLVVPRACVKFPWG